MIAPFRLWEASGGRGGYNKKLGGGHTPLVSYAVPSWQTSGMWVSLRLF